MAIAERLEKAGADLVSLTEKIDTTSAAGKMVFRMLAVMAEFERDLVSERTRAAMSHKKSKGEVIGQVAVRVDDRGRGGNSLRTRGSKEAIGTVTGATGRGPVVPEGGGTR